MADPFLDLLSTLVDARVWRRNAACYGLPNEVFFPRRGQAVEPAKRVCAQCDVSEDCLEFALANFIKVGVFGGKSERERRRIRRERRTAARLGISIEEAAEVVRREIEAVAQARAARVLTKRSRSCHCPPDVCFCLLQRRRAAERNGRLAA